MPAFDSFRATRWIRTVNLVLQAVLFLTLFGGLNYLARHQSWRFDLTRARRYSLSPETRSYLADNNLKRPVEIFVTLSEDSDNPDLAQAARDVGGLLKEYSEVTAANTISTIRVTTLDIFQNRRLADQLGIDQPNVILVKSGDKRRVIPLGEIYGVVAGEKKTFRGEQAITAAILDVCRPGKKKVTFLTGHGELQPDDVDPQHGLSALREELRARNFDVDVLDLAARKKIPADASVLVAASPQGRFSPLEQELLRSHLTAGAGRLILLLAPGQPHGLEDLLLDWGMIADDDLVCDAGPDAMTEQGELILSAFSPHPITQTLIDYKIRLAVGPARSVRPDPGRSLGGGLTVTTLAATSTSAWGEVSYRTGRPAAFDPGVDIRPLPGMEPKDRLGVAVAAERVSARGANGEELPFSVRGGRLVAFGTGDLVANNRIAGVANQNVFLAAVNWTVDGDTQLNVPARPIERFQLSLSAGELIRLRYALWFVLPGLTALLGFAVYWTRRR